jgi:hypothetical protein
MWTVICPKCGEEHEVKTVEGEHWKQGYEQLAKKVEILNETVIAVKADRDWYRYGLAELADHVKRIAEWASNR